MIHDLPVRHLDEVLAPWRERAPARPRSGWLRAIREALGMTIRQFAKAADAAPSTVMGIEQSEARGDVTLSTLKRYAEALGCELQYVLVPKRPLQQIIEERAEQLARAEVAYVHHSMSLENQATDAEQIEREVAELRRKLLEGRRSRLWV